MYERNSVLANDNIKKMKRKKDRQKRMRSFRRKAIIVVLIALGIKVAVSNGKSIMNVVQKAPVAERKVVATAINAMQKSFHKANKVNLDGYPESLVNLYNKNEDARGFVADYKDNMDKHEPIDISGEVDKGIIPLFLQWDERWGYENYGNDFLAITGCGPTSLSMVYSGLTGKSDINPYEMAQRSEDEGFYVAGTGTSWSMMTELANELGLNAREGIFDEEHIRKELNAGNPIICIMGPGDFTETGHFIVLTGISDDGKIIVNDPNSIKNSEKAWDIQTIMSQTRNLWVYSV